MTDAATIIGLIVLVALTVFQILLVSGKPIGEYAWGGQHKVLPRKLRIGSVSSIIIYIIFAVFLVSKAGWVHVITHQPTLDIGMWIITGYFFLGILVNGISRSKKERVVMVPVSLLLAVSFLIVSLGL